VKNVTFSADNELIEAARARARAQHSTLNEEFRRWLEEYARPVDRVQRAMDLIRELQTRVDTGGKRFTREERNER
jgi:hypothetical protein